jgi:hypothetical protein
MRNLNLGELFSLLGAFTFGGRFLNKTPHLSRDEMRDWQWQRIRKLVTHAYTNVPFYRELYQAAAFHPGDLRSWDDFHRLPTVSKDQVIAHFPDRMLASGYKLDDLVVSRSSGSSGKVLDIAYDSRAMVIYTLAGLRLYGMGFPYGTVASPTLHLYLALSAQLAFRTLPARVSLHADADPANHRAAEISPARPPRLLPLPPQTNRARDDRGRPQANPASLHLGQFRNVDPSRA